MQTTAAGVAQAESKEGKGSMGGLKRISDKETAGVSLDWVGAGSSLQLVRVYADGSLGWI
eukprot:1364117-Amorphochlora_amoeboformis.AAC.1